MVIVMDVLMDARDYRELVNEIVDLGQMAVVALRRTDMELENVTADFAYLAVLSPERVDVELEIGTDYSGEMVVLTPGRVGMEPENLTLAQGVWDQHCGYDCHGYHDGGLMNNEPHAD